MSLKGSLVFPMSDCPFAWDWVAAVTRPAGTRGCSRPEGPTFHDTAIPSTCAVTWPPGHDHWPGAHHHVHPPQQGPLCPLRPHYGDGAPQPRHHRFPRAAQRGRLLLLAGGPVHRLLSDHARSHSHYMAAHPVDAEPPNTLRFSSTKPKPANFAKEAWYKEVAKRKLFLFDPRQSGEETLPIYYVSSRSAWG